MAARRLLRLVAAVALVPAASACTAVSDEERLQVVASFYPLAWVAQEVGGDRVTVTDLTPPGGEAHDATLTAGQRVDVQTADVVLLLGRFGFQPDLERVAGEASGMVVDVTEGLQLRAAEGGLDYDPHIWLDPILLSEVTRTLADALAEADPGSHDGYERREADLLDELDELDRELAEGLSGCAYPTFLATHEAFGYLASRYGIGQLGLRGIAPESEPTGTRLTEAARAIADGDAGPVVFAEATAEGRRIAEGFAGRLQLPVHELSALESAPEAGDYLSVMRENLDALREGLECI